MYGTLFEVSLGDVVDLKSRGCRKLKRGNTGVPMYMSLARFTGVVRCCCCSTVAAKPFDCCGTSKTAAGRGGKMKINWYFGGLHGSGRL